MKAKIKNTSAPKMKVMRNIFHIPTKNARGQALVELALLLPVLLLLIIGSIEFGRAFFLKNMAINAARQGARNAVVLSTSTWDASDTGPIKTSVRSAVTSSSIQEPIQVDPDPGPPTIKGQEVTVIVKVRFNTIVPNFLYPFRNISSVTGRATMRYEGL